MTARWTEALAHYQPLAAEELPGTLRRIAGYAAPDIASYPPDFLPTVALCLYSSFWSGCTLAGLPLNLWGVAVMPPDAGAQYTTDRAYALVRAAQRLLPGTPPAPFTGGSLADLAGALGNGGGLVYLTAVANFLALARRTEGARDALANLADGRDYTLGGAAVPRPHVSWLALATRPGLERAADREDIYDGYLSRFLWCAPEVRQLLPTLGGAGLDEAAQALAGAVAARRAGVRQLALDGTGDEALAAFRDETAGPVRDGYAPEALPTHHLPARALKVAGLLALAGEAKAQDNGVLLVGGDEVRAGARVAARGHAYATRVDGWLGKARNAADADRIYNALARHYRATREGRTPREVHVNLRVEGGIPRIAELLTDMVETGELEKYPDGKTARYRPTQP